MCVHVYVIGPELVDQVGKKCEVELKVWIDCAIMIYVCNMLHKWYGS